MNKKMNNKDNIINGEELEEILCSETICRRLDRDFEGMGLETEWLANPGVNDNNRTYENSDGEDLSDHGEKSNNNNTFLGGLGDEPGDEYFLKQTTAPKIEKSLAVEEYNHRNSNNNDGEEYSKI